MADPLAHLVVLASMTAGIAISAAAGLRMWHEWLDLRRRQIGSGGAATPFRREIAELRQRIRHLESIANGEA